MARKVESFLVSQRRKLAEQREKKRPTDTDIDRNRIRNISNNLIGNEDPEDLMLSILSVLKEGSKLPQTGKFYTFVYNAKTRPLVYDQHPCLLYTSPSPRDVEESRMPSSA